MRLLLASTALVLAFPTLAAAQEPTAELVPILVTGQSRGYIAVSVDENFLNGGIRTENDARGWMLLKHLKWAILRFGNTPIPIHKLAPIAIASSMLFGASLQRIPLSCAKKAKYGILMPAW